jgi:phage baseplate assembly protein W
VTRRARKGDVGPQMGRDLQLSWAGGAGLFEGADLEHRLTAGRRDLVIAESVDNITQALINRLMTRRGELAPLGHADYGSRHHELIGEPNALRTRNLIKLYVLQALRNEPRIEKVLRAQVTADKPPRDVVRIELTLRLIGVATPINLIVPFSLEAP